MIAPTITDLKSASKVDFEELGYLDDDALTPLMLQADAYIVAMTGRQWGTMPPYLEAVATQAAVLRAEQIAYRAQEDYQDAANDDVLVSFSAGSYSETRTDPASRGLAKALNSNPALAELLWLMLITTAAYPDAAVDAQFDMWRQLLSGVNAPAFEVTEVDWSGTALVDWYSQWQRTL